MIDDPQAVRFCNERIRRIADLYSQLYYASRAMLDEWAARGGSELVPDAGETIDDGADADGRPLITGTIVNQLVGQVETFATDLENNANLKLKKLLAIAVNPTRG